ncbi:hypothetical protein GTH44_42860 [Bradyrhizobium japonicum]|nr:hypothetical protein [Bradyrhizobium japonicum]
MRPQVIEFVVVTVAAKWIQGVAWHDSDTNVRHVEEALSPTGRFEPSSTSIISFSFLVISICLVYAKAYDL